MARITKKWYCTLCGKQVTRQYEYENYCATSEAGPSCQELVNAVMEQHGVHWRWFTSPSLRREGRDRPQTTKRWTKVCAQCATLVNDAGGGPYCDTCSRVRFNAHRAIYAKRFRTNHTDKFGPIAKASEHRRRAKLLGAEGSFSADEWKALMAVYNYQCAACGSHHSIAKLSADHIVPVALGGANSIDNIQPLCKSCNSTKHLQTWLPACQLSSRTICVVQ